jgi:hypothetical protein
MKTGVYRCDGAGRPGAVFPVMAFRVEDDNQILTGMVGLSTLECNQDSVALEPLPVRRPLLDRIVVFHPHPGGAAGRDDLVKCRQTRRAWAAH